MRTIKGREQDPVRAAIEKEQARRHLAQADDEEVARLAVDVSERHLAELLDRITHDPMRAEATKLEILRLADELAGPDPSPAVKLLARVAAMLKAEYDVASTRYLHAVGVKSGVSTPIAGGLLRWRGFAARRLGLAVRSLAAVRKIEESKIETMLNRLKLAG
jgi:hypothetical protein